MSRRAVTPSLEASQQTHIDDLVHRNRAHERTIQNLKDEITKEKLRAKSAVLDIQAKLHDEKHGWREAVDTLQTSHRIHAYRLQVEIESAKCAVMDEQELLRHEKVAGLQKQYTITKFQMQESELERRIDELEDELDELKLRSREEKLALKARMSELQMRVKVQGEHLESAELERAEIQGELNTLHQTNAESQVSSESLIVKLERSQLQLEGERSKNNDLEQVNDDLKRSNEDLKRQIAKWQSLESKGDTELETARRKRVELEVQLQVVQNQLAALGEENASMQRKLEVAKERINEWQGHVTGLEKKLTKGERANRKLLSEIESLDVNAKNNRVESEDEVAQAMTQLPPSSPPTTAGISRRRTAPKQPSSNPQSQTNSVPPAATSSRLPSSDDADEDVQEVKAPARPKGKGRSRPRSIVTENEAETAKEPARKRSRAKSSSKKSFADSDTEEISAETVASSSGPSKALETKQKRKRKAPSPLPAVDEDQGEDDEGNREAPS
ncbi:hypothetical protein D9757_002345 [Collybiopsis confluens]|uniref:Uncharacterized protein n=1 Tax=Collybiopsis confluens TaxID=2823264 RepID=A0A8H5HXU3_9AGAR|nr:hypothetical protein D9757_002345 [Collybiopsis confluens]